jgi:hypothetical protein
MYCDRGQRRTSGSLFKECTYGIVKRSLTPEDVRKRQAELVSGLLGIRRMIRLTGANLRFFLTNQGKENQTKM